MTAKSRRRASLVLVGVGVVAASALLLGPAGRNPRESVAPRFVARVVDPRRAITDYRGMPLLLNVWATWCDPCREEMPSLEQLYREYQERGLRVVAISIDDDGQAELIREFVREHNLTFDVLHDPRGGIMRQYPVRGVPQTFLISRRGQIRATRYAADWLSPTNRALVDSLLLRDR